MKIVKFPDPSLFVKTQPVTVFGPELKVILDRMYDVMIAEGGIGLAANQVGLNFRMFVMKGKEDKPLYLVNPEITWETRSVSRVREGCLSAPGEFVSLIRPDLVKVEFQDEKGEKNFYIFNGIYSVCAQHEIEHLDGKSFMKHKSLTRVQQNQLKAKWGIK